MGCHFELYQKTDIICFAKKCRATTIQPKMTSHAKFKENMDHDHILFRLTLKSLQSFHVFQINFKSNITSNNLTIVENILMFGFQFPILSFCFALKHPLMGSKIRKVLRHFLNQITYKPKPNQFGQVFPRFCGLHVSISSSHCFTVLSVHVCCDWLNGYLVLSFRFSIFTDMKTAIIHYTEKEMVVIHFITIYLANPSQSIGT